ncbi:putative metal-dependent protease of the PAD1/JAB1 superfamily [Shewanella psychrophila]|uniref:Putative metal-dependent protease of the PAD1/JAB1 superfamily n=1 Tax=Shewanella psychrophila TaxID=225848 RepID=A0A1S6HK14_9GAMM|nr:M67 family metallopeptidase [Shewanella psychrophila]AQS35838.1 putative metal-dependent protease of the PAD1/JAB1 superfamily [Shewanella psychrophila]
MSIEITRLIEAQFLAHAKTCYPHECCGFITGIQSGLAFSKASYYLPCHNTLVEKSRRFLIDPLQYQDAEDRADEQGLDIISIVHSHPDHNHDPSEFDRLHAWPGLSYIIISVLEGQVSSYRSWQLREDHSQFDAEDTLIEDES